MLLGHRYRNSKSTGATIYVTVRAIAKGQKALADILELGKVEMLTSDQNSLASVEVAAKDFLSWEAEEVCMQGMISNMDVHTDGQQSLIYAASALSIITASIRILMSGVMGYRPVALAFAW